MLTEKNKISFSANNEIKLSNDDYNVNNFSPLLPFTFMSKEIQNEQDLMNARRYMMSIGKKDIDYNKLKSLLPQSMFEDMSVAIRKHIPDASEEEILLTIYNKFSQ